MWLRIKTLKRKTSDTHNTNSNYKMYVVMTSKYDRLNTKVETSSSKKKKITFLFYMMR